MTAFGVGMTVRRLMAADVDERSLHWSRSEDTVMASSGDVSNAVADDVLKELQAAVAEHERILQRQEELIVRLRNELKDVRR